LVGTIAISVLMTWVYQHTAGSVLMAVLIHWLFNTAYLGRGQLPVMSSILAVAALIVVAVNGPAHLSRTPSKLADAGKRPDLNGREGWPTGPRVTC
jgi:hypothetical protein